MIRHHKSFLLQDRNFSQGKPQSRPELKNTLVRVKLSGEFGRQSPTKGGAEGAAGQVCSPFLYRAVREYRSPLFRGPEESTEVFCLLRGIDVPVTDIGCSNQGVGYPRTFTARHEVEDPTVPSLNDRFVLTLSTLIGERYCCNTRDYFKSDKRKKETLIGN